MNDPRSVLNDPTGQARPDRTRWWVALGGSALAGIAIGVWFYQSVAG